MQIENKYRFSGIERLMGHKSLTKLQNSHVLIIGIGGVGSWTCEALIRSGIGNITLLDADDICITNTNRQIHTLSSTIGSSKIQTMKDRLLDINPDANVNIINDFLTKDNIDELITDKYDFIFDAIDRVSLKCLMLLISRKKNIPLLMAGGAAGKVDPSKIVIKNLEKSSNDMLLMKVKKRLRQEYGFIKKCTRFRTKCIYSSEPAKYPSADGEVCSSKPEGSSNLDCHTGMGTASFVTGTFGFLAAAHMVEVIGKENELV
ncbi:MAG: tRNA threonylcarbamoyladenosine dehydratase [Bacteriovoracaceae bacterium]|nr:tRNA threonylcarbamoyladenosine dehydratase [Bacteriovoracaceae bacterium]